MKIAFFDTKSYDKPSFEKFGGEYGITFKFFETKLNEDTADLAQGFDAVCVFVNDTVNADLTEMERRVLTEIKGDAHITILKMAEKLGVSKITINRTVKGLKEKNLIQREGSAKAGKWIILK